MGPQTLRAESATVFGRLQACLLYFAARIAGRFCIKTTDMLYLNNTKNAGCLMWLLSKQHIVH